MLVLPGRHAAAASPLPPGYKVAEQTTIEQGVEYVKLSGTDPRQSVNVARVAPDSPTELRTVLSDDHVAGPGPNLERTSSMCRRINCLVAVNGDFYGLETGQPLGGVVVGGELQRSPSQLHHQLVVSPDGRLSARTLAWTGRIESTDLKPLSLDGVNTERMNDQIVLYSPAYGSSTGTNRFGVEITAMVEQPKGPLLVGQTAVLRVLEYRGDTGDTPVPPGGVVLSGHGKGAEALQELWQRVQNGTVGRQLLLRLETDPPASESLGGTPILVREGRRWTGEGADSFGGDRHPRTMVGWTSTGEMLIVTVDGRQPGTSVGMTLGEGADLMIALGATEAINLDGGGSTTFVVHGAVANRPSDRLVRRKGKEIIVHAPGNGDTVVGNVERPVAVSLALVEKKPTTPPGPPVDLGLDVPKPMAIASPSVPDPASNPEGSVPGLVAARPPGRPSPLLPASLALNIAFAGLFATRLRRRRPRDAPAEAS